MKIKACLFALLSTSCLVNAEPVTFYGKVNVTVQSTDDGDGSFSETKSNNSRVGVKGDYSLSENLELFYLLEWQVDVADISSSDNIKSRNQYIGLRGDMGEIAIGRNDTMLKQSQGKIDLFSDYESDIKVLWKGENRLSNTITYKSPKFNGFQVGVTHITEEWEEGDSGTSFALFYGDKNLKKSDIYAAVAYDAEVNGYDTTRASVQWKLGKLKLGAMAQQQESVSTGEEKDGVMVSAAYSVDAMTFKGQYQTVEDDNMASIGMDYKLGKNTKAFAWLANHGVDESDDKRWLAVGLEHKF